MAIRQTLGDSTLAALMKSSELSAEVSTKSSRKPLKETSPNVHHEGNQHQNHTKRVPSLFAASKSGKSKRQLQKLPSGKSPTPKQSKRGANPDIRENTEEHLEDYFNESLVLSSSKYTLRSQKTIFNLTTQAERQKHIEPPPQTNISEVIIENFVEDLSAKPLDSVHSHQSSLQSPLPTQARLHLSSWGLPQAILSKYSARGMRTMFPWQVECLSNPRILENSRNLVYSAPTSAGKTLVSEILVIKTVIERKKKVIFILPFVSVVREKMYYFQDLFADSGVRVDGFMGGMNPPGGFASTDVAIATIEKANSLVNQMMEAGGLEELGAVVIDELHLLGDSYRGYLLELLLTKLKYMTIKVEGVNIQLIGMSATLPNLDLLAKWLNAELFSTDYRPVPLKEFCKIGGNIQDNQFNTIRTLSQRSDLPSDSDNVLQLCLETISDGHSVLIFCPTKNWCEKLAQQVSSAFSQLGRLDNSVGKCLRNQLNTEAIMEILEQLKRSPAGLDDVLKGTVSFGVAYHHAGLTMDERDIIEGAFRSGAIRVLTATSTLSSGVNLPARRVIIRTIMFHGRSIDVLTYRQMIGRAGRMGKDTAGESILICKPNESFLAKKIFSSELPPIESCLKGPGPFIRALLEAIASEVAYTIDDIDLYTKCTLLSFTDHGNIEESTKSAIEFLVNNELLLLQVSETGARRWVATQLGKACLAASVPPKEGLFLFEQLQKARKCFVLDTELHVIYLVTPLTSHLIGIDWHIFLDLWRTMSDSERRVGQLVGVNENFIMKGVSGVVRQGRTLEIHNRFYTALALYDLVREIPLNVVCKKYSCCRGIVQSLQQTAATSAGMITQFCKKLGWNCMELLVSQFQTRLQFGVNRELLDLLRLPMLNGLRARSIYKEGIETVVELATADELNVERALLKALPFESDREFGANDDGEKRRKMRCVFVTGRDGLTPRDAARLLVKEARALVQSELKLDDVDWKKRNRKNRDETDSFEEISGSAVILRIDSGSNFSVSQKSHSLNVLMEKTADEILKNSEIQGERAKAMSDLREINEKTPNESSKKSEVSLINSIPKTSSRSPSLFDDSLNLDTQECNILERNVIDLDLSAFDASNLSEFNVLDKEAHPEKHEFVKPEAPIPRIPSITDKNKSKSFIWDEDSWNNTNAVIETLKKQSPSKKIDKSIEKLRKLTKRKLNSPIDQSPIVNVKSYDSPGGLSACSNKSEDEVIVASQIDKMETIKTKTRLKLESMRIRTQRSAKKNLESKVKSPTLTFLCNKCSTGSVITNSDDGLPQKEGNTLVKPKIPKKPDFRELKVTNISEITKFNEFKRKLIRKNEISLALACDAYLRDTVSIGTKIIGAVAYQEFGKKRKIETCVFNDRKLCGVALSFGKTVYFMSLDNSQEISKVPIQERIDFLQDLLKSEIIVKCFASKEVYKTLFNCCSIAASCRFQDPLVADWLLNPEVPEKTFINLVNEYLPEGQPLMQQLGPLSGSVGPGCNTKSSTPSEARACTEALLTFWLLHCLVKKIKKISPTLLSTFQENEMTALMILGRMELSGVGINLPALQELSEVMQQQLSSLEDKAFALAGKKFNFSSSKSVAQVLGMENGRKVSTSKAVLEQLDHPIAKLVINWRKLNSTRIKMVCPLLTLAERNSRIRGTCLMNTATGRVSMCEPNLQNVPRDFDSADESFVISVRMAFVPTSGNLMISADYCQLELRILAHFSEDSNLCSVLRKPGDVFKNIAAKWYNEAEARIDDVMRQRTKQLCYGMIYGMGRKSLADSLGVDETTAEGFMETFMKSYPGLRKWLNEIVEEARRSGFVATLMERRRVLPGLNGEAAGARGQAERQAVNTMIQGSAADIAKRAMILVDQRLRREFPGLPMVLPEIVKRRLRSSREPNPRGGHLILQLHDELLYEVNMQDLDVVARIIKESMEGAYTLNVPLPVRLKFGPAWGELVEY